MIGLSGLEARVDERLDLLARNADDRHGTMRSAMGWSWALLDDRERSALLQCAIFRGTFSFDAAEQVVLVERAKLLPTLKSLADKSLVTVVPEQGALPPRLALFQTVREFVFEKLSESGELAACQARLDAYVLTRGRVLRAELERRGAASARVELAHELDNLLDVHERALAKGGKAALETALDALLAAEPVLSLRDPRERTALRWAKLEAAFGTIRGFGGARRAELVGAHGVALGQAHRPGEAEAKLTTAIRLARRSKARRLEGRLELDLGLVLHTYRALARARDAYLAALRLLDEDGAERLVCRAHANLGALLHDEKDFAGAEEHYERAIAMAARLGDLRIEGISLTNRAVLAQEEGDLWRAETALRQAIHLLLGATDDRLVAIARGNLGALLLERGDLARARSELEAALELLSAQGDARSLGIARVRVAMLATLARDDELARTSLLEARAAFLKASSPIDLGLVEIVLIVGDAREFRLSLEDARARIREVLSRKDGDRSLEDARDDARSLGRVAETALRELANSRPREVDQLPNALVVGPDAETFRAPGEGPRYIGDHDAPRKILLCLLDAPDQTRTLADLVAAGWEGQSLHPLSATNRVHVALAYLRKQGLARVIQRIPGGYRIDPSIAVLRVDRPLVARPPSKKSAPRKPASQRPRT
ncbi:MAG: tetratricopeptide repeat protein [Polyangiaceae bacterium]